MLGGVSAHPHVDAGRGYASGLITRESLRPVEDIHFHPVEPRTVRATAHLAVLT
jgi:hypothetical protein